MIGSINAKHKGIQNKIVRTTHFRRTFQFKQIANGYMLGYWHVVHILQEHLVQHDLPARLPNQATDTYRNEETDI